MSALRCTVRHLLTCLFSQSSSRSLTILQYLEYLTVAAAVCIQTFLNRVFQTHVHKSVAGNTLCSIGLLIKPTTHTERNGRVSWWGQDYFNSSLCNHFEALSQSGENLPEYSASQQPSQKQQGLKLPGSPLALHPSVLWGNGSRGISAQRGL